MQATYRKEKSLHGHSLDELKSGLQKYIRRGMLKEALYCLGDLDCFSDCGQEGKRIRTNMIHRLMIIYLEDVGLGGYNLWSRVDKLVYQWLESRSDCRGLQELVHIMCAAKKTRACSFAKRLNELPDWAADDPDYERAQADLAFKSNGFKWAIENKSWAAIPLLLEQLIDSAAYRECAEIIGGEDAARGLKWSREIKTKERPLTLLLPLLNLLFGSAVSSPAPATFDPDWEEHRRAPAMKLHDFVYDKHTRQGPRDLQHFITTTSQVTNEVYILPGLFKRLYAGQAMAAAPRESAYELVIRCQLVCSASKTDSVLAICPDSGELVFLKGPFKDAAVIEQFISFQAEKKRRGMPYLKACRVDLVPDRWESTPLGVRNSLDCSRAWPFLVTNSVIYGDDIVSRIHKSSLWPPTVVMAAGSYTVNTLKLSPEEFQEYVAHIKFRVEFNIGDLADRNFIRGADGHIYSIDEEVVANKLDLEKLLSKARYSQIKPYL